MKTTERLVIYSGLALSLLLALSNYQYGSVAIAKPAPGIAADSPRIATVDILSVVERMVSSDKYKADRKVNDDEQLKSFQPLAEEIQKIQEEAKDLKEESEKYKGLSAKFAEVKPKYDQARQNAANIVEKFNTLQVAEVYRLVLDAANTMATTSGYTHVIASKGGAPTIASTNIPGAVQEMLARPVIKGVAADDLTERLIKELNLENVVVTPPAAVGVPATGAAPAGGGSTPPAVAKPVDPK